MTIRWGTIGRVAFVVVMLAALLLFARTVNWAETWRAIRATSLGLLVAASLVNVLSLVLKAARWWTFLRPVGVTSLWVAVKATFAGAALNNLLIANGGDAARVILVSRTGHVPSERVLATLALERLVELLGYFLLLAFAASVLQLPPPLHNVRPVAFGALVVTSALLVYLTRHPERAEVKAITGEGLLHRVRHYGREFFRTLTQISTSGRFAISLGFAVGAWGLQVLTYALTARAANFPISLAGTVAALLAVNIGFALRATPGNVGVFQMVYAMSAAAFGMSTDEATAVAFLIQTQQILPVTVLGLLAAPDMLFARRKTERPGNVLPGEPSPVE